MEAVETVDVLVVGAGISGIAAGCLLQQRCPDHRVAIVEARRSLGGTWDLFRYPGVRSDSDMYTLGFSFRPWTDPSSIAAGPAILAYLQDTAREHGLDRTIRFGTRVVAADWSTAEARWTVQLRHDDGRTSTLRCGFLYLCSGYYDYAQGHQPDFPGLAQYGGRLVHPQHWPADLDVSGRRVLVIGSGATAVTLVPALARDAAQVTMLQRSPTWLVAQPSVDPIGRWLARVLPLRAAAWLTRWKNILLALLVFRLCRRRPGLMQRVLLNGVARALGPEADIATDYTPRYRPWEQRLCLVPDGDFFKAVRSGRARVVTGEIQRFTPGGVLLRNGQTLDADLVVSATGLTLSMTPFELRVDGVPLQSSGLVNYRGTMFTGVPNLATSFGYTNASWTLKAELTAEYVCRLLLHMRRRGLRQCRPGGPGPGQPLQPWVDFSSGYFTRAARQLPRQGSTRPWKLNQNYLSDLMSLRHGALDDGVMQFS